jgi:toxin ParE1/3/4
LLPIEIHPEVYKELEASKDWYEEQSRGLGDRFLDEVDLAMAAIAGYPEIWPPYVSGTRRFLLHRFPFAFVYFHSDTKITVVALMHFKRKPGYWKNRVT